jgi:hypothetical protein
VKIQLTPITIDKLKPLIKIAFEGDKQLQQNLPNPKETFEQTVERIYNCIEDLYKCEVYRGSNIELHTVSLQDSDEIHTIGYSVLIKNSDIPHELYSFGIQPDCRINVLKKAWLREIDKHLGDYYYIGLHKENIRAINFFIKNGFKKNEETELFVLLFSNFDKLVEIKEKELSDAS